MSLAISDATRSAQTAGSASTTRPSAGSVAPQDEDASGNRSRSPYTNASSLPSTFGTPPNRSLLKASSSGTARKLLRMLLRTSRSCRIPAISRAALRDDRRIRVPEAVDGLLAVPDDEDGGDEREILRQAEPRAPGLDQAPHQLPLRLARVLELVDEQVVVAGLEQVAALRELVHLLEQFERAPERVRKIDDGVRRERAAVLLEREREEARDAAREHDVQVAPEAREVVGEARGQPHRAFTVPAPGVRAVAVGRGVAPLRARLPLLGEEVVLQLLDERTDATQAQRVRALGVRRRVEQELADLGGQEREPGMVARTVVQEPRQSALDQSQRFAEAVHDPAAHVGRREVGRALHEEPAEDVARDQASLEQHGETLPEASFTELREHQRHRRVGACDPAARAERGIERLVHEAQHLGLVGHAEARVEVRLQRKLPEQREAERVDRADRDVAEPVVDLAPAGRGDLAGLGRAPQGRDDALAHLRRGLPGEGDGEDVARIDACLEQVDVAIHQHPRLAGAGRRLEHHVPRRVDRGRPIGGIGQISAATGSRRLRIVKRQARRPARRLR